MAWHLNRMTGELKPLAAIAHVFDRLLAGHADQHGPRRGATSAGEGRGNRAWGASASHRAAVRFHTQTLKPRSSRRAAIAAPMAPSPITPAGCWRVVGRLFLSLAVALLVRRVAIDGHATPPDCLAPYPAGPRPGALTQSTQFYSV